MFVDTWSSLRATLDPILSNPWVLVALALALLIGSIIIAFQINSALDAFRAGRFSPWIYRLTGHKRRHTRALNRERRNQPGGGPPATARTVEPDTKASP